MSATPDRPSELKCVRRSDHVRASACRDGVVLLDLEAGLVLTANGVGARIWELIEEHLDASAIAKRIADDYGVPLDRAQRDVAAFLHDLESRGLVATDPA